eukprot:6327195-Amphidinium_carterae.2
MLYEIADTFQLVNSTVADAWPSLAALSSAWTSSSSSTSVNEVPYAQCVAYTSEYAYTYGYVQSYYGYYSYWYGVCGSNSHGSVPPSIGGISSLLIVGWLLSFTLVMIALNNVSLLTVWQNGMLWLLRHVRGTYHAIGRDARDIWRALAFLGCELLFVLARRSPVGHATLRKAALKWRPYVAREISGEPVFVESPQIMGPSTPAVRRSLACIQLEYQVVQGGQFVHHSFKSLLPCRWVATRRVRSSRTRAWHVTYNPAGQGDCLFAVLCKYAGGHWTVKSMRKAIQLHAAELLVTADPVLCGRSLTSHLQAGGIDPTRYLQCLVGRRKRWGNSIDALVASDTLKMRFVVHDIKQRRTICDPGFPSPAKVIGYADYHFTAGFVPSRVQQCTLPAQSESWRSPMFATSLCAAALAGAVASGNSLLGCAHCVFGGDRTLLRTDRSRCCQRERTWYASSAPSNCSSSPSFPRSKNSKSLKIQEVKGRLIDHDGVLDVAETYYSSSTISCVWGGMHRATIRDRSCSLQRAPRPELTGDEDVNIVAALHCADWKTPDEEVSGPQRKVHVSVENQPPYTISVPAIWSTSDLQWMLARHMGMKDSWLEFTWVQADVHICRSPVCPVLKGTAMLHECGDAFARQLFTLNTFTNKLVLPMGLCTHDEGKLSACSIIHEELVRALAMVVGVMVPDVVFNVMLLAITPHNAYALSNSFFHTVAREVILIPYGDSSSSWVWFAVSSGADPMEVDGEIVSGTWSPLNKVICITASAFFSVSAPPGHGVIVLYKQALEYTANLARDLVRLGFPLDEFDLTALDTPEERPASESQAFGPPARCLNYGAPVRPAGGPSISQHSRNDGVLPIGAPRTRHNATPASSSLPSSLPASTAVSTSEQTQTFESLVMTKLLDIEEKQDIIIDLLRQAGHSVFGARASAVDRSGIASESRHGSASTLPQRPWRQGGAAQSRSHPICPGRFERSSSLLLMSALPCEDFPALVSGGMSPRRRYPFADKLPDISLIFHGSFAPFHMGHVSCILDAHTLLKVSGFNIVKIVVGSTTSKQLRRKHDGSDIFADPVLRADIAQAVLQDAGMSTVVVDRKGHSSGDSLAWQHGQPGSTSVYIVGSDVRTRPSPYTIIVLRSAREDPFASKLDVATISGTCSQQVARGSSSTSIREELYIYIYIYIYIAAGTIPDVYGEKARKVLERVLQLQPGQQGIHEIGRAPQQLAAASSTAAQVPLVAADDPVVATAPSPILAKAMPRRRIVRQTSVAVVDLTHAAHSGPVGSRSVEVAEDRPPLRRRRVRQEDAEQAVVVDVRPPLQRRRVDTLRELHGAGATVTPPSRELTPAQLLLIDGRVKFAPPAYSHLATFHRMVVVPICRLLRIVPLSTVRRNGDPLLRVEYIPLVGQTSPLVLFMEVEQFMELSNAMGHASIIPHYYLAFKIMDLYIVDKDLDTIRGQHIRKLFGVATNFASENCPFGDIVFSVTMYDAHHFVCAVRAFTAASMGVVAGRIEQLLNQCFSEDRTQADGCAQQNISFVLDSSRCCLVHGGMQSPHRHHHLPHLELGGPAQLVNPGVLADLIEDRNDNESPCSPRPPPRDLVVDLECDEYDLPWIRWYIQQIREELLEFKESLVGWKQMNGSPPAAPQLPLLRAAQPLTDERSVVNPEFLDQLERDFRAQLAAERAAVVEPPFPSRDVWSHLDASEQITFHRDMNAIRRVLTMYVHNLPPAHWWRYFGRSPENDAAEHVLGGAKRSRSISASQLSSSSDDACYGEQCDHSCTGVPVGAVVHIPKKGCADPLMDCISWVVSDSLFPTLSEGNVYATLRMLASRWLVSARKHDYLIAGVTVATVADLLGVDVELCPTILSEARCLSGGAHYLVYAISCMLQLKVRVVDHRGVPYDGFTYVDGLGIRSTKNGWVAIRLGTYVADDSFSSAISPTLPFAGSASSIGDRSGRDVPSGDDEFDDSSHATECGSTCHSLVYGGARTARGGEQSECTDHAAVIAPPSLPSAITDVSTSVEVFLSCTEHHIVPWPAPAPASRLHSWLCDLFEDDEREWLIWTPPQGACGVLSPKAFWHPDDILAPGQRVCAKGKFASCWDHRCCTHQSHSQPAPVVHGGAGFGALMRRSIARSKALVVRVARSKKMVTLHCGKAIPLQVFYENRISTRALIAEYASRKRVGRQFISIALRTARGSKRYSYADTPVFANWNGKHVTMVNKRYSVLSKPTVDAKRDARRQMEIASDRLVDSFVPQAESLLAWDPLPLPSVDDFPTAVQKCAERMLDDPAQVPEQPARSVRRPSRKSALARPIVPSGDTGGASGSADSMPALRPAPDPVPHRAPPPTTRVRFECEVKVPSTWTIKESLDWVKQHLRAENCLVSIKVPLTFTLRVPADPPAVAVQCVEGGGRSVRVQHDTVAMSALCYVLRDLASIHCTRFSPQFLKSVLMRDRKCALASFRAATPEQRLRSMTAAFRRMGLDDKAEEMVQCIVLLPEVSRVSMIKTFLHMMQVAELLVVTYPFRTCNCGGESMP